MCGKCSIYYADCARKLAHEAKILNSYKKLVGGRIKAARIKAGFPTQEDLAVALCIDRTRVSRWESGENSPKGRYLKALLEKLQVNQEHLFRAEVYEAKMTSVSEQPEISRGEARILELLERQSEATKDADAEIQRLRAEIAELDKIIAAVPKAFYDAWPQAEELAKVLSLYFLSGDKRVLQALAPALKEKTAKFYRAFGLHPLRAKSRPSNK